MRLGPTVNPPVTFIRYLGLKTRLVLERYRPPLGHVYFQALIEHDIAVVEVVAGPELSRSQRINRAANELILQDVSGTQRRHANVLLVIVGIHQRIGIGHVLHARFRRIDDGAVGLDDAHIRDFELVAEGAVAHFELAEPLHRALAVDLDAPVGLAPVGSVVFEAIRFAD
jgi:hypothetical protein